MLRMAARQSPASPALSSSSSASPLPSGSARRLPAVLLLPVKLRACLAASAAPFAAMGGVMRRLRSSASFSCISLSAACRPVSPPCPCIVVGTPLSVCCSQAAQLQG
jgi:hypothetical protein